MHYFGKRSSHFLHLDIRSLLDNSSKLSMLSLQSLYVLLHLFDLFLSFFVVFFELLLVNNPRLLLKALIDLLQSFSLLLKLRLLVLFSVELVV